MIQITPQMRIVAAVEPADFRRGIDGLARLCKDVLKHDPFQRLGVRVSQSVGHGVEGLGVRRAGILALPQAAFQRASSAGGRRARTAAAKTLAAHQLQVLLSAGNPEATQAAPTWRSVGPAD